VLQSAVHLFTNMIIVGKIKRLKTYTYFESILHIRE